MFGQQNNQNVDNVSALYAKANNDASSLQIRLDTESIKLHISRFLRGRSFNYKTDDDGKLVIVESALGEKKVNDNGYQAIMSFVESIVNKATVMGNFETSAEAYDFLRRVRRVFTKDLWINMTAYGIKNHEFCGIVNNIFSLVEPFITRTIGDGERATVRDTIKEQNRVITGAGNSGFDPFRIFKKWS